MHSRQRKLGESPIGKVSRPDYAHRRQVPWVSRLLEAGFQFVDKSLGQCMASTRAADDEGLPILQHFNGLANA